MPGYGEYQREIYGQGLQGQTPSFTTRLEDLDALAKAKLDSKPYFYVAGSAGANRTYNNNIRAFDNWRIIPRMLRGVTERDCSIELFGDKYDSPVFLCPIGVLGIVHEEGEEAAARAAGDMEVPYCMSNAATRTIEQMAAACGEGPRWVQLYWPLSDDVTISYLQRAKAAGCKVLVVTLDTTSLGFRPSDLDQAYLPFLQAIGTQIGMSDPVLMGKQGRGPLPDGRADSIEDADEKMEVTFSWMAEQWPAVHHTWKDLALLRKHWKGPIVLKGICSVDDARKAIAAGMDGIMVSNHGGRQVDGANAALDNLAAITADRTIQKSKLTILFDSGIRSGADVIKALALGAQAVGLGRPYVYGLALEGEDGVRSVLRSLLADIDVTMGHMGCGSIKELGRDFLVRAENATGPQPEPRATGFFSWLRSKL